MRTETSQFVIPASTGDGDPIDVRYLREKAVQISSISGTLKLMGSLDGTNFVQIGSTISADAILQIAQTVAFLRVDRASGSLAGDVAFVMGFDSRST